MRTQKELLIAALLLISCGSSRLHSASLRLPPPSPRTVILISDTHFGVGKDGDAWHPFEDSRWAQELDAFVTFLTTSPTGPIDLVLLGDTFEMWQSRERDCIYPNKNLSCRENEAVNRLRRALENHGPEIASLRRFAESDGNRIILVPGNHDAALLFPSATKVLKEAFAPLRFSVATKGYYLSDNGQIYAEHGHQIGKDPGGYKGWPAPFVKDKGKKHLRKVWGERFVQDFYDPYEQKYPIVDNITDDMSAAKLAFAAEGFGGAVRGLKGFFRMMVFGASWAQFVSVLGPGGAAPEWDYDAIRKQKDQFFLDLIDPSDPLRQTLEAEAKKPGGLGIALSELTKDDLKALCDMQQMRRVAAQNAGDSFVPQPCPTKTLGEGEGELGAATEKLFRSRNSIFSRHLDQVSERLKKEGQNNRFQVFVYGHTHLADEGFFPKERNGSWNPKVVNTGAWQRVISPAGAAAWMREKNWTPKQLLEHVPEELPPPVCFSFVRVVEGDESNVSLRFWRRSEEGKWEDESDCD